MMLVLALPFRHYVECLVIPFISLIVQFCVYANPPENRNTAQYIPDGCTQVEELFDLVREHPSVHVLISRPCGRVRACVRESVNALRLTPTVTG